MNPSGRVSVTAPNAPTPVVSTVTCTWPPAATDAGVIVLVALWPEAFAAPANNKPAAAKATPITANSVNALCVKLLVLLVSDQSS